MNSRSFKSSFRSRVKFQKLQSQTGYQCFFTMFLAVTIMMCLLIIIGFPKIVIGVEYIRACPLAPYVPIYLVVSGCVGIACPLYSVYLWMCVFGRVNAHLEKTVWVLIWIILALTVPIVQLAGGSYIIYIYTNINNSLQSCSVTRNALIEAQTTIQNSLAENSYVRNVDISTMTTAKTATSTSASLGTTAGAAKARVNYSSVAEPELIIYNDTNQTIFQTTAENFTSCLFCDRVVMDCAFVTVCLEYILVVLPMIIMSIAVASFRRQESTGDVAVHTADDDDVIT